MSSKHKHLAIAVAIATLIMATGFSMYFAYAQRILPFVSVEGISLNHTTKAQAEQLLAQKFALPTQLTLKVAQKDIPIETNKLITDTGITKAVQLAYDSGRLTHWPARISLPIMLNGQYLTETITKAEPSLLHAVEEPTLSFANDSFTITDGKPGIVVDTHALAAQLIAIAHAHATVPITIATRTALPASQPSQYTPLIPQATTIVKTPMMLSLDSRTITVEPKTIASWLTTRVESDGDPKLYLNQDAVKNYAASIAKTYNRAAIAREIDPDGKEVRAGQDGKKINEEKIITDITHAIGDAQASKILIAFDAIPAGEKRVDRPYTLNLYPGKYIEVSLSKQRLFQIEGGTLVAEHVVSTGKWAMPTPQGTFSIQNKAPRAHSAEYNLDMPWWMNFLNGKYGIHELPEFADGRKEGEGHLGQRVSHGCIRLGVGDAEQVYNWADVGTPVVIDG